MKFIRRQRLDIPVPSLTQIINMYGSVRDPLWNSSLAVVKIPAVLVLVPVG